MSRRPRLQYPGAIYHVMLRGNRKLPIFGDDDDRLIFMRTVDRAAWQYGVCLFAWCLMATHYHLVIYTPRGNLSDAMRHINGVYTQSSNRLHGRTGHVFEGRFKSFVVQKESYLRRVVRYVVLNPVRAHLVADPAAWAWSSYRATAGLDSAPRYLSLQWMELAFPETPIDEVRQQFAEFVASPAAKKATLGASRDVIGSPSFARQVRQALRESRHDRLLPIAHRALGRPTLDELFTSAATHHERNERIVRAHVHYGYRMAEIAQVLGVHPSTVSLALRHVEPTEDSGGDISF